MKTQTGEISCYGSFFEASQILRAPLITQHPNLYITKNFKALEVSGFSCYKDWLKQREQMWHIKLPSFTLFCVFWLPNKSQQPSLLENDTEILPQRPFSQQKQVEIRRSNWLLITCTVSNGSAPLKSQISISPCNSQHRESKRSSITAPFQVWEEHTAPWEVGGTEVIAE